METLENFVVRLAKEVKCYYHQCKSNKYSLKKVDTNQRGGMGVFGWVEEKKRNDVFEISTYKTLGDKSNVTHLADRVVPGMHYISKKKDGGEATGIVFCIQKGSGGRDYQKAVQALRAILPLK
jgi:hypothetical protein